MKAREHGNSAQRGRCGSGVGRIVMSRDVTPRGCECMGHFQVGEVLQFHQTRIQCIVSSLHVLVYIFLCVYIYKFYIYIYILYIFDDYTSKSRNVFTQNEVMSVQVILIVCLFRWENDAPAFQEHHRSPCWSAFF